MVEPNQGIGDNINFHIESLDVFVSCLDVLFNSQFVSILAVLCALSGQPCPQKCKADGKHCFKLEGKAYNMDGKENVCA